MLSTKEEGQLSSHLPILPKNLSAMITELRDFVIDPCIWLKLKTFHLITTRGLTPKFT